MYYFVIITAVLVIVLLPSHVHSEVCVQTTNLTTVRGISSYSPDLNRDPPNHLLGYAWTWSGVPVTIRTLIDLDFLKEIPPDATIQSATLSLYADPEWSAFISGNPTGHTSYTSPNAWSLAKVTSVWDPNTVTWNNQPSYTTGIDMPTTTSNLQDYPNIDVTSMVRSFVANPSSNHGLLLKLQLEQYYAAVVFATTKYSNSARWPKLVVNYTTTSCGCGNSGGGDVGQMEEKWSFRNISIGRGSHFNALQNKVYFVEEQGRLSTMDMMRGFKAKYTNSSVTIPSTGGRLYLCGGTVKDTISCSGYLLWNPATGILSVEGYMATVVDEVYADVNQFVVQRLTYAKAFSVSKTKIQATGMVTLAVYNPGGNVNLPADPAFDYAKVKVSVNVDNSLAVGFESYNLLKRYVIVGTGYIKPQDVKVTADGKVAYISELGNAVGEGAILKVDLTSANKNRFAAVVLASRLNNPRQLVIDENHQKVYFVMKNSLSVINDHRIVTEIFGGLTNPSGLVMSSDFLTAYVSEVISTSINTQNTIIISKLDLVSKTKMVLPFSFTGNHLYLNWVGDTQIYAAEAGGSVQLIDIINNVNTVIASASCPVSVTATGSSSLVIVGVNSVHQLDLRVNLTGPLLLGIGHVPVTSIDLDGYATTDAGYFFSVTNSPFGGSLSLMINHAAARKINAKYYQVYYGGILQTEEWSDYIWQSALPGKFVLRTTFADASKMFVVRNAIDLWYNPNLGYILNTRKLTDNVIMRIEVRFFNSLRSLITSEYVQIFVDNSTPRVDIGTIFHHTETAKNPVDACGVVFGSSDKFTFNITVLDDEESLLGWNLYSLWGKNKYSMIAASSSTEKKWAGFQNIEVPQNTYWLATREGDASSRRCAHTFILQAWDRSINGYQYINGHAQSHTSVTLWLDA